MNKKAKFSGKVKSVFFKALGQSRSKAVVASLIKRSDKSVPFSFPIDTYSVGNVLIFMPEQPIEILYQLKNLLSILSIFKHATISVVCEENASNFIKMIPGITIIEYKKEEKDKLSPEFIELAAEFENKTDLCLLLDRKPHFSILYFVGITKAAVRAGYEEAGGYPFLNLKIRSSLNKGYISDSNCLLSQLFGLQTEMLRMAVARKTLEEVDHLLKESHINPNFALLGIDALFFLRQFGEKWLEQFLALLHKSYQGSTYLYISDELSDQEQQWFKKQNEVTFFELTAPRIAALIYRTDLVIAGNTIMYGLAAILNMTAIGFFTENEKEIYCPDTPKLKGIIYKGIPDEQTVSKLVSITSRISSSKK
jgi:hypothetical protein